MTEGAKTHTSSAAEAAEIWKQWFGTSAETWSALLAGSKGIPVNPYILYDIWARSAGEALKRMKADASEVNEVWKQWIGAWQQGLGVGGEQPGFTAPWLEILEEARNKILAGGAMAQDPFTWFLQWYEVTSEMWAKAVGDLMGTEQFMEAASQSLESLTRIVGTLRRTNEAYFSNLQLATRSDIARVAGLVVALEEKVDRFEDAFDDFTDVSARTAPHDPVSTIEERLVQVESKLETLSATLGKIEAALEQGNRLDQLEDKLDSILAALARGEAENPLAIVKSTGAPRRLSRTKSARQPKASEPLSE